MLEEGVSNHCHERVAVKAMPRSSFEVIETEFFFQLLVPLFDRPPALPQADRRPATRVGRQVRTTPAVVSAPAGS